MGTTLVNFHILDGDEQQARELLPDAITGCWSKRFISIYPKDPENDFGAKAAKNLSKKVLQPVLHTFIFDSDSFCFTIYQSGKTVARHFMGVEECFDQMGNIPLFCEIFGLSKEDAQRMRKIWKKGDAEEQLWLTSLLLGAPLYHDYGRPPDNEYFRDVEAVDKWIAERPEPQKVKDQTKALLIQELTDFRMQYIYGSTLYCSATPLDVGWNTYDYDELKFWKTNADGSISADWSTTEFLDFMASNGRIIGTNVYSKLIEFDSAGLLPKGYDMKGICHFLPGGGLLWQVNSGEADILAIETEIVCCAPDGCVLWKKPNKDLRNFFAAMGNEIIFTSISDNTTWVERINGLTGECIEKRPSMIGYNTHKKIFHNGLLWVAHDDRSESNKAGHALTKLDDNLQVLAKLPLPASAQEIFHSPDYAYLYAFFYKNQVMAINAQALAAVNILKDKSFLIPRGFDATGRFWIQRDNIIIEAWDSALTNVISRHKLKGQISGTHKDAYGNICAAAYVEKEKKLRIYRLE